MSRTGTSRVKCRTSCAPCSRTKAVSQAYTSNSITMRYGRGIIRSDQMPSHVSKRKGKKKWHSPGSFLPFGGWGAVQSKSNFSSSSCLPKFPFAPIRHVKGYFPEPKVGAHKQEADPHPLEDPVKLPLCASVNIKPDERRRQKETQRKCVKDEYPNGTSIGTRDADCIPSTQHASETCDADDFPSTQRASERARGRHTRTRLLTRRG